MTKGEPKRSKAKPPELPKSLGPKIRMPKQTNVRAARRIAEGQLLWDRRHVERTAQRRARKLAGNGDQKSYVLLKSQRLEMLAKMPSWEWNSRNRAFQMKLKAGRRSEVVAEMMNAMLGIMGSPVDVYVCGLTDRERRDINETISKKRTGPFGSDPFLMGVDPLKRI